MADALPDLTAYDAVLFDLDGVLTPTAEVHMHAWQSMFQELFAAWNITPEYTERDYFEHLDGKKRYDGVASLLWSRDVEVPWGDPSDAPELDTVCGIGNRKNVVFEQVLRRPQATLDAAKQADAVLLGAVGGPKWSDPKAKVRPEQGLLAIRKALSLCARPSPPT